ncbi:4'-phosphopantetheinyl transferase superfamily protein [Rhizobium changzhiense]|uniref:4'-phosphopantetheinyl transferase family protein n=1 Tax=Rhizobium changzhiense TaxID=2692317 RepID=UPI001F0BF71F|nr:4'-phosphopantetheinyl transferase superfamily protein [Rhizobium changzhiense]MCH4547460.1 4'-phosphopantetheinyl transferase superfamily protein [Rhizobium changzhiense]
MRDSPEIAIFIARMPGIDAWGHLTALLSEEEQVRLERLISERSKAHFVFGRHLLRIALSRHFRTPTEQWEFKIDKLGKPRVLSPQSLNGVRFSLSHTEGLVGCAISPDYEVGLDVENLRHLPDAEALAQIIMSTEELAAATRPVSSRTLLRLWTAKESYVKALGTGFLVEPSEVSFEYHNDNPSLLRRVSCDTARSWRFESHYPASGYVATLAHSGPDHVGISTAWVDLIDAENHNPG